MRKLSISFESYETMKAGKGSSNFFGIPHIPERSTSIVTPHGVVSTMMSREHGSGLLSLIWASRTRRTVIALEWEYPTVLPEPYETMSMIYPSLQKSFEQSQSSVSTGETPSKSTDGEQTP